MRTRESYFLGRISATFGIPAEEALRSMACASWSEASDQISSAIGESIQEDTLRRIFKALEIPLRKQTHSRATGKGKHQKAVARHFGRPFNEAVDMMLLKGEGMDEMCWPIESQDPMLWVNSITMAIFGKKPATSRRRANLRNTVLKAMAERSARMGLRFHLRPDFPSSVMRFPDDDYCTEESVMKNASDIEEVLPKVTGMVLNEFIQVGDGHILVFEGEGGPAGVKMMPTRASDGRVIIAYEPLNRKDVQQYASRALSSLGSQKHRAESVVALTASE